MNDSVGIICFVCNKQFDTKVLLDHHKRNGAHRFKKELYYLEKENADLKKQNIDLKKQNIDLKKQNIDLQYSIDEITDTLFVYEMKLNG